MSDEEREFAAAPTRSCLMVCGVEVAPETCFDRQEVTKVRALCWQHGSFHISDGGERVRLPVQDCAECATGAA